MAAITTTTALGDFTVVKTGTAQADTGQTIWCVVPAWPAFATVYFSLTASAGTTPVTNLTVLEADPLVKDDTYAGHIGGVTLTAQNTTGTDSITQIVHIGPGVTGIADDVILGATGVNRAAINTILPKLMGLGLVFDRTTGNETYTYKLSVALRK